MKILKPLLLTIAFLLISNTTQAQFWKKLGKKTEKAAKETVNRKVEDKTAEKTDKAMDSLFNIGKKGKKKNKKKKGDDSLDKVDENLVYNFKWKYTLKMEFEKKRKEDIDMVFNYYIDPNSTAFASEFDIKNTQTEMMNMIMIMDPSTGLNIMLTKIGETKIKKRMPSYNDDEFIEDEMEIEYTIIKTDTKTILNYQCQGFKITTQDAIIHTYVTNDAPISFNQTFEGNSKMKPKGFKKEWLQEFENGLMMEMQYKSKKKKKYNMKIICIGLVEEPLTIDTSDYQSFGF